MSTVTEREKNSVKETAYKIKTEDVPGRWEVDPEQGLSSGEVKKRRKNYGPNELPKKQGDGPLTLFLKQFKDVLILILFIAAAISWYGGQMANVYIILAVILFNAIMGFVQEYKAEKAVESIKKMVKHKATVIRNGKRQKVVARDLVPGDVLELEEGQTVVGDARLIQAKNLRCVEASLTGESTPSEKKPDRIKNDTEIADRHNMVWKSTHVVKGSGKAVVVATGGDTEIGKIARSLSEMKKKESNFRKKTGRLARKMALIAIITSSIVFLLGYFYRSFDFQEILMVTIASLVSSVPEGLPVVISIVLAIGAGRMAKRNAIIREFTATEVLGSVTTILTDKTGTITQSILTVKRLFGGDNKELTVSGNGYALEGGLQENGKTLEPPQHTNIHEKILAIAAHCNKAGLKQTGSGSEQVEAEGDPTEIALKVLAEKSGIEKRPPYNAVNIIDDVPFNSEQKFRATLVEYDGKREMLVVGAPEVVLGKSSTAYTPEGVENMDEAFREHISNKGDEWADQALRVIGVAHKQMPDGQAEISADEVTGLTWTGILGIIDPPREGVKESIEVCREAGIRVVMVTGDHKKTAAAIAREVGITSATEGKENGRYPLAMEETDLSDLREEQFDDYIRHVSVFARMSPQTKMRIADRLQADDELVAMTGDGVNDAPALKKADVGIAMGQRGTDVAKDAAQIVLSDDNFSSIVNAVHEGRIVFKNLKTTTYFLVTTNVASAFTLITALLTGFPIPITAIQILWVNMVTDGIMDVAKVTEPGHGGMMKRKPVKKNEPILRWEVVPYLLIMTVIMVTLALLVFRYYLPEGVHTARTGTFFVIAMTQVFNLFNMRDLNKSVFTIGFFSNKWINLAFFTSIVLQLLVVKVPFLQDLFGFKDIAMLDFAVITLLSTLVLWAGEIYKLLSNKRIGD